ncbi:MAG: hypothetical protein IPM38_15665 [Ignavibacteria bacterium]|nr:hypothetical protein [Ignavibacteria bacterium]
MKLSLHIEKISDINNYDDTVYLMRGITVNPFIKSHLDGFVYYVWFKLLSVFTDSNVGLYFLNNSILLVLPALILFIFLRVIKVNLLIAFVTAAVFMLSSANVFVIPFITKFALCLTLTGFIVLCKIKSPEKKLLFSVFLSVVLLYIRPEFILTLILSVSIYAVYVFKNKGDNGSILRKLLPVVLLIIVITLFNPVSRHRANVAFTQHYAMGVQQRSADENYKSGKLTDPEEIMRKDFSTDYSMTNAVTNNPALFFEHIRQNALRLDESLKETFPYFINKDKNKILYALLYILSLAMTALFFYFLIVRIRKKKLKLIFQLYIIYALPLFISIFIYYPRLHYIVFIFAFILIYLSYEISLRVNSFNVVRKYSFTAAMLSGIILTIAVPYRAGSVSIHESRCTAVHTIKSINNLNFNDSINFLAAGPGISAYIEKNWNIVKDYTIDGPLENFIGKDKINLILVDNFLLDHPSLISEKGLESILNDSNFVKLNIPHCTSFLLAEKNLLK